MYSLVKNLLFLLDAERSHRCGLSGLNLLHNIHGLSLFTSKNTSLPVTCLGLNFPNPVGLAAGLDKDGEHIEALFALGFGFVEVGTVTPRPQAGNPLPRLFRLPEHQAIINRFGFNNKGVDALVNRVNNLKNRNGILGINIGKNKETANDDAASDYLYCMERVYPLADYITINISSPNTAGLRDLQEDKQLRQLMETLRNTQQNLATKHGKYVPMLVKIAPDLDTEALQKLVRVFTDLTIDGVIATNTTINKQAVANHQYGEETGGLSGAPLLLSSNEIIQKLRAELPRSIPIIGVGGIMSGENAVTKYRAGSDLIQCYSGLIYRGPALISECIEALRPHIKK